MAIEDRGFASMNKKRQRQIASMGGRAAHVKGTAHQWTRDEAREAGRKGGLNTAANKKAAAAANTAAPETTTEAPEQEAA